MKTIENYHKKVKQFYDRYVTFIFVKCSNFAKMLRFAILFAKIPWFCIFNNNIMFLISIS